MQLVSEEQELYSSSELQEMDRIIEENMEEHLKYLIQTKIASILQSQTINYQPPSSLCAQLSFQSNIANTVNRMSELWAQKQQSFLKEINNQKQKSQIMQAVIAEKEQMNSLMSIQLHQKDEIITDLTKQKHSLNSMIFQLKQELSSQKLKKIEERLALQKIIHQNMIQIQQLSTDLKEKVFESNNLIQQNKKIKEQSLILSDQLAQLEQWLVEDVQRVKLDLITSNILVNEISESHQQKIKQIQTYVQLHHQHIQIVKLLAKIGSLVQADLVQIGGQDSNFSSYDLKQFGVFNQSFKSMQKILVEFTDNLHKITFSYLEAKKEVQYKTKNIESLQIKNKNLNNELQININECMTLQQTLNKQKIDHYNGLIDVQRNKSKIQVHLFQTLSQLKKIQQKCISLEQNMKQKQSSVEELLQKMEQNQIEKEQLSQALKQQQNTNYQLREQMLNIKSNLQIMVKTEGDDEDSSFNIVQQLIDKNNDLTNQLTLKKMELELKEEKNSYQVKLIEKNNQQIAAITTQAENLKEKLTLSEKSLTENLQKNEGLAKDVQVLKEKVQQLYSKQLNNIQKDQKYTQTQADQTKSQTVESRIKRQIVKQSIRSQVQKSHSLLSQREENKQNSEFQNIKVSLSSRERENYKEKIMTLNQIINFMMNYSKGFQNGELRKGSWFTNQIAKHGQEYEQRLMHASFLGPRLKNAKFIKELCKQDANCNRLIKQFQGIIDFYLSRSNKINSSMQPESSYMIQQRLNKTINKSRNPQQSSHIF